MAGMKVKELIDELSLCEPEQEVYLAIDEEGNGFNPLSEVCVDPIAEGELTDDNDPDGVESVVLWP